MIQFLFLPRGGPEDPARSLRTLNILLQQEEKPGPELRGQTWVRAEWGTWPSGHLHRLQ